MSARHIAAMGNAFSHSLKAATGVARRCEWCNAPVPEDRWLCQACADDPERDPRVAQAKAAYVAGEISTEELDGILSAILGLPGPPELVSYWRNTASRILARIRPLSDPIARVRS